MLIESTVTDDDFPLPDDYERHLAQMAEAVSARVEDFDRLWTNTFAEQQSGVFDTVATHIERRGSPMARMADR